MQFVTQQYGQPALYAASRGIFSLKDLGSQCSIVATDVRAKLLAIPIQQKMPYNIPKQLAYKRVYLRQNTAVDPSAHKPSACLGQLS
jgi:hypothetical protein